MEKDYELGKFHFEKARELCPSDVYLISRYALMLIYIGDSEKALSELKRAMRLDPFSHDVLFSQEGMCYYWLEDYKKAVESFRKVKILRQNLFYLAACYIKMGDLDNGLEKLKEAESVTGQNSDAFVDSLPYEQKDMMSDLRNTLNSAKG
jgi:tetratricopeptide (TPR) repeat protein